MRPFNPLHPPNQPDVLIVPFLCPNATPQRHDCDLDEDLELRRQSAIHPGRGRYPVRETLKRSVEECGLEVFAREKRWTLSSAGFDGRRRSGEGEGVREHEDHMAYDSSGAELVSLVVFYYNY